MRAQSTTNTTIDARRDKLITQFQKLNKTSVECTIVLSGFLQLCGIGPAHAVMHITLGEVFFLCAIFKEARFFSA
jgi:hypothetical protein